QRSAAVVRGLVRVGARRPLLAVGAGAGARGIVGGASGVLGGTAEGRPARGAGSLRLLDRCGSGGGRTAVDGPAGLGLRCWGRGAEALARRRAVSLLRGRRAVALLLAVSLLRRGRTVARAAMRRGGVVPTGGRGGCPRRRTER